MKKLFFTTIVVSLFWFPTTVLAEKQLVVLELFTSQGCSSCPPADALLQRIGTESANVIAMSYHVDYWNYLGWRDPYSNQTATDRQRAYARAHGDHGVYTPQLIVNGGATLVGSRERDVRRAITNAAGGISPLLLNVQSEKNEIVVSLGSASYDDSYLVRTAIVYTPKKNAVPAGENAGRTLSHHNVVTQFYTGPLPRRIPKADLPKRGKIVVFVQHAASMKIVAAGQIGIPDSN